jgi:hypothetical protein
VERRTSFVLENKVDNLRESIASEASRSLDGSFGDGELSLLSDEFDLDLRSVCDGVHGWLCRLSG